MRYLFTADHPEQVIETMAAARTRIVPLTVTDGGYSTDPVTGAFGPPSAQVHADLQPGAVPTSAFGRRLVQGHPVAPPGL